MVAPVYFTPLPSEPYFTVDMHLRKAARDKIHCLRVDDPLVLQIYDRLDLAFNSMHRIPAGFQLHLIRPYEFPPLVRKLFPNITKLGLHNAGYWGNYLNSGFLKDRITTGTLGASTTDQDGLTVHDPVLIGAADPCSGEEVKGADIQSIRHPIILDLTFSYPFDPDPAIDWDAMFFQVNGAMGVPFPLLVVYADPARLHTQDFVKISHDISASELYVLQMVAEDYVERGMENYKREMLYKKAVIKNALLSSTEVALVEVPNPAPTIFQINPFGQMGDVIARFESSGMIPGKGSQFSLPGKMLIGIYPTHSKEQAERLADFFTQM